MQRWIAALLLLLVGGSIVLATACSGGGATKAQPSGTGAQTPPGRKVTPQPLPTVSTAPYLSLGSFQFLDSQTGWLATSSCRDQPRPTPDEHGTAPTGPPTCKSGFYGTVDGGQTWSLLSHDGVGPFVMDSSGTGLAAGGFCQYSPCNNSVLRTMDGGRHWAEAYSSALWLTDLTFIDGEAWLLGNSCGYSDGGSCERYLLKSTDGGSTWSQTPLPITGLGISISRPTKHDAWMASSSEGAHAQPAEIKVTHDEGKTWQSLPHPTGYAAGEEIVFRTPEQGWLLISGLPGAGNQWKDLFRTEDGGTTWTHLSGSMGPKGFGGSGTAGYAGPLTFTSDREGWIALARRGLIHSADGGVHWAYVNVDHGQGEVQPVVQFSDPQHGWTVSDYYDEAAGLQLKQALWSTSDGGATWQQLPLPAPESP